jgi:hypothetical protein
VNVESAVVKLFDGVSHICVRMFVNASLVLLIIYMSCFRIFLNTKEVLPTSLLDVCGCCL